MFIHVKDFSNTDHTEHLSNLAKAHDFVVRYDEGGFPEKMTMSSYSVFWCPQGRQTVRLGGQSYTIGQEYFLLVNPGEEIHLDGRPSQTTIFHANVNESAVRELFEDLRSSSRTLLRGPGFDHWPMKFESCVRFGNGHITPVLDAICKAADLGLQDVTWITKQLRILVELLLYDEYVRNGTASLSTRSNRSRVLVSRLKQARQYIDGHFASNIEIQALAKQVCVSHHHFIREFRKYYGETPYQYLINRRLDAATKLIRGDKKPVAEICNVVGFTTADSFYRAFRRRFKQSPTQFRAESVGFN